MKRISGNNKATDVHHTGDIKRDLSAKQLAGVGAATLAFNALEDELDQLLEAVTRMPRYLFQEVSTRINGLEGKVNIIQAGIEETITVANCGLAVDDIKDIKDAVGTFMELKKIRDTIIHARIVNASIGIGVGAKQRGKKAFEVLLSVPALETYYLHVVLLSQVLATGSRLLNAVISHWERGTHDPYRSQFEQVIRADQILFQDCLCRRRSLPPLPQFPDEAELREAAKRWRAKLKADVSADFQRSQQAGKTVYFVPENLARALVPPPPPRKKK